MLAVTENMLYLCSLGVSGVDGWRVSFEAQVDGFPIAALPPRDKVFT